MANYVTQAFHRYGTKTVARSRQEIVQRLDAGLRNYLVGVFQYVSDWQKTMMDQAKQKAPVLVAGDQHWRDGRRRR